MIQQNEQPVIETVLGVKYMVYKSEVFEYKALYDIDRSIEDLFTSIEKLGPPVTNIWARPGSLEQILTSVNEDGSLMLHFYNFRLSPEPVGWMARGAHEKLFWQSHHESFLERHMRILLWIVPPLFHQAISLYDPSNTRMPEGFKTKEGSSHDG